MTTNHPITPPPELVQQWANAWHTETCTQELLEYIATQAARWGADQELEACEKWLSARTGFMDSHDLHNARRPKPPSLKEQALEALQRAEEGWRPIPDDCDTIRRALEALPDE